MRGLEVSLCGLAEDLLVQRQVGHRPAKSGVLRLKLLQTLYLVALKAAVFTPPAVVRDLRHANRPDRFRQTPPAAIRFAEWPLDTFL